MGKDKGGKKGGGNGQRQTPKPLPKTCPNGHQLGGDGMCRELGCPHSGGPS